jgi:hypothetical protein
MRLVQEFGTRSAARSLLFLKIQAKKQASGQVGIDPAHLTAARIFSPSLRGAKRRYNPEAGAGRLWIASHRSQ